MNNNEFAIELVGVGKRYSLEARPWHRLWTQLIGRYGGDPGYEALSDVDLAVRPGEVVGLIGRNGAGKSTLLQIVCGVLQPSSGRRHVRGRIAALLELGAGFNPELTGRENVILNGSLLGLTRQQIELRLPEIIDFAGIGTFIEQPVRSYSSGMFMRLAFSMATSVDPDVLVIDEALSVGDGAFARQSFDRIMELKDAGKTILFCSHSTHHIEALCGRALWLERGRVKMVDAPARTVAAYNTFLASLEDQQVAVSTKSEQAPPQSVQARIAKVEVSVDGISGRVLAVQSRVSALRIDVDFMVQLEWPVPTVAVGIVARNGSVVASAGSHNDGVCFVVAADGSGRGTVIFPALPLLKGEYFVRVFLMCERGVHIYEYVERAADLVVSQHGLEQGVVALPHVWRGSACEPPVHGRAGQETA